MPRLDVYKDRNLVFQVKLEQPVVTIGRGRDCLVSLHDLKVSRQHAELKDTGEAWEVCNFGRNGTRVNAEVIQGPTRVTFGDRIYVGQHALLFQADEAPLLKRDEERENHPTMMEEVEP